MKKSTVYILLLALFLIGCTKNASETSRELSEDIVIKQPNNNFEKENENVLQEHPTEINYTFTVESGQNFTIHRSYKLLEEYFELIKGKEYPKEEMDQLYLETVLIPFSNTCMNGLGPGTYTQDVFQTPSNQQIAYLESLIEILISNNVEGIIQEALLDVSQIVQGDDTTICVMPVHNPKAVDGVSFGNGSLIFFFKGLPIVDLNIKVTIVHEYTHSIDTIDDYHKNFSMLDYIIPEGKAVFIQEYLYPMARSIPTYEDNPELSAHFKEMLSSTDFEDFSYLMGWRSDSPFPIQFGYVEAYKIVQSLFEERPDLSITDMIQMDAEELLKQSKYYDKLGIQH